LIWVEQNVSKAAERLSIYKCIEQQQQQQQQQQQFY